MFYDIKNSVVSEVIKNRGELHCTDAGKVVSGKL